MSFAESYGPRALITGASSGIGEEFARQLAGRGLDLMLVARREERLQHLAGELSENHGVHVEVVAADLTLQEGLDAVTSKAMALDDIGLLVNNAGISIDGYFLKNDLEDHQRHMNLNMRAPMVLTHQVGQQMLKRERGGIIMVSSVSAFFPVPYISQYSAGKSYLLFFGEALSVEMKRKKVDVQVLCPGFTRSEMTAGMEGRFKMLEPDFVVKKSLDKLGKKMTVVPGWYYSLMSRLLPRVFSRRFMVGLGAKQMGR